ncbi:MAG TPA: hypothetical protein VFS96_03000 [Nitrolancea sp.]|nr:hypothetical protein [Nitrolancea sp.]
MTVRALSQSELLDLWDYGPVRSPVQRAMLLLAASCPGTSPETLADLSIGHRDALLLTLRELMFGPRLECFAICPGCNEQLELAFNTADIQVSDAEPAEAILVESGDYQVSARLPDSHDLVSLPAESPTDARRSLFERCVLQAARRGESVSTTELPEEVVAAVADRMSQADPIADIQFALTCPVCAHEWLEMFDIVSFLWSEINAGANRLLRDVNDLALAYGWREADILAMSPLRRQRYLEMIGG